MRLFHMNYILFAVSLVNKRINTLAHKFCTDRYINLNESSTNNPVNIVVGIGAGVERRGDIVGHFKHIVSLNARLVIRYAICELGMPMHTINVLGGCYKWESSAPLIVTVKAMNECGSKAVVTLIHTGQFKSSIYITAHSPNSIHTVPLRIRPFTSITILTQSRWLNVKEVESLKVVGFDLQGNSFTSLEGLIFTWTLQQQYTVIEKVYFKNARFLIDSPKRIALEQLGKQTDIRIIKTLVSGNVLVRVKFNNAITDSLTISVHEKFELEPEGKINVVVGSEVQFSLKRLNGELISLPQPYYNIIYENGFTVNNLLLVNAPLNPAETILRVQDTRTKPPHFSYSVVTAYVPNTLEIKISPYLIVGQSYPVSIILAYNSKILSGKTKQLIIDSTINIENGMLRCTEVHTGTIKAVFRQLKAVVYFSCFLPMKVFQSKIILPTRQYFQLMAFGGSESYNYESTAPSIASVSATGEILTFKEGLTDIIISDINNPENKVKVKVSVEAVIKLASLQDVKELNINEDGQVYTIAMTKNNLPFTRCDQLQIKADEIHNNIVMRKISFAKGIQQLIQFSKTNQLLRDILQLNAQINIDQKEYKLYIKDVIKIRQYLKYLQTYSICSITSLRSNKAYESYLRVFMNDVSLTLPLRVYDTLYNQQSEYLMTPMSQLHWKRIGGSYKWSLSTVKSQTQIFINGLKSKQYVPIIKCPSHEQLITISLSYRNEITTGLIFPVQQTIKLKCRCQFPHHIAIQFNEIVNGQLMVLPNTRISGYIKAFNKENKSFYNSSNLLIKGNAEKGALQLSNTKFTYTMKNSPDKISFTSNSVVNDPSIFYKTVITSFETFPAQNYQVNIVDKIIPHIPNYQQKLVKDIPKDVLISCQGSISCHQSTNLLVQTKDIGQAKIIFRDKRVYGSPQIVFHLEIVKPDKIALSVNKSVLRIGESTQLTIEVFYKQKLINKNLFTSQHFQIQFNDKLFQIKNQNNFQYLKGKNEGKQRISAKLSYIPLQSRQNILIQVIHGIRLKLPMISEHSYSLIMFLKCNKVITLFGGTPTMQIKPHSVSSCLTIQFIFFNKIKIQSNSECSSEISLKIYEQRQLIQQITVYVKVIPLRQISILGNAPSPLTARLYKGSQLRLNYHLLHNGVPMFNCVCNYEYQWYVEDAQIVEIENVADGVNVTAHAIGNTFVKLYVMSDGKKIAEAAGKILVIGGISLEYAPIIGMQVSKALPLYMPFDSELTLQQIVQKVPCGQKQSIQLYNDHKIVSKGNNIMNTIKVKEGNTETKIVVETGEVAAVFLQNNGSFVTLNQHERKKIKYYLLDSFARIFHYKSEPSNRTAKRILIQNKEIVSAKFEQNSIIEIVGLKEGTTKIYVFYHSLWDTLTVRIGNLIEPHSPIIVVEGGTVQLRHKQQSSSSIWHSLYPQIANVNANGLVQTYKVGTAKIAIDGIDILINVVPIKSAQFIPELKSTSHKKFRLFYQLNNQIRMLNQIKKNYLINNAHSLRCDTGNQFYSTTKIQEDNIGQYLLCDIIPSSDSSVSKEVKLNILNNNKIIYSQKHPYFMRFVIKSQDRNITLSERDCKKDISINTLVPIKVDNKYIKSSFDETVMQQKLVIDMEGVKGNNHYKILLQDDEFMDYIEVHYIENDKGYSQGNKKGFDWPEYLILFMALVIALIYLQEYLKKR